MLLAILGLVAGAGLLVWGAEWFAENVATAASKLGLSIFAVGLLLAGAEPEEAVTAVLASLDRHPALAAGDAIGANLVILALALGLAALLFPLPVDRRVKQYAGAAAVAGALALLALLDGRVGRGEGAALVLAYAIGVVVVWRRERVPPVIGEVGELTEEADEPARSPGVGLALAAAGIGLMVAGGWVAVRGAERLTGSLNLTDSTVGLTILALATSAEMLALVFAAARHQVAEVAVAGMVGSAAYNATVSLGLASLARPLELGAATAITLTAAGAAVLPLALVLLTRRGHLGRPVGALLVASYAAALALLLT